MQVKGLPMLESHSFGTLRLPFWHTGPAESSASPDAPNLTGQSRPFGAGPGAIEAVSHRGRQSQRPSVTEAVRRASVTAGGAASLLLPVCLGTRPLEHARFGFLDGAALAGRAPTAHAENQGRLETATGNRAGQDAATHRYSPCRLTLHGHPAWLAQQSRRSRETVTVAGERERRISLLMTSRLVASLLVTPHLAAVSNPARPKRYSI
ncbi:hypothetical protein GGP45_003480 [Salinibacter ruber]|uniref:Uncharacterized protein n=1 Tax=Salinibacter ruber TaxID=146919 RepID=A0A9X2VB38_9BACT|nr:hypothetical protein [Salinibacter ruber]